MRLYVFFVFFVVISILYGVFVHVVLTLSIVDKLSQVCRHDAPVCVGSGMSGAEGGGGG